MVDPSPELDSIPKWILCVGSRSRIKNKTKVWFCLREFVLPSISMLIYVLKDWQVMGFLGCLIQLTRNGTSKILFQDPLLHPLGVWPFDGGSVPLLKQIGKN